MRREAFLHPDAHNDPRAVRAIYSTSPQPRLATSTSADAAAATPASCVAYAVAVYDPHNSLQVVVEESTGASVALGGAEHSERRNLTAKRAAKPGCVVWGRGLLFCTC